MSGGLDLRGVLGQDYRLKADVEVAVKSPAEAAPLAKKAEKMGFDTFWVNETKHDPFIQLALAAAGTERIGLGTSIALAFTRSPTTLGYTAWDIQNLSHGRLTLGLGSQVKGHIERRFGLRWEPPAPKMKEVVLALRSVWKSWQAGEKLNFQGRFFKLDLMTPFFNPGPIEHPSIPIYVAAVNEGMARVAGSVAEGVHLHPFHTIKYLEEVIAPAVSRGAEGAGRRRGDVKMAASVFAAVGSSPAETARMKEELRGQIAFYASTRSYRRVLELHGWEGVCDRLHRLAAEGDWGKMPQEVPEDMLDEIVLEGTWREVGELVSRRYGRLLDQVRLYLPFDGGDGWRKFADAVRA